MEDELEELGKGLWRKPKGESKEVLKAEEKLGNRVSCRVYYGVAFTALLQRRSSGALPG
jgi:hypothetical protein